MFSFFEYMHLAFGRCALAVRLFVDFWRQDIIKAAAVESSSTMLTTKRPS